MSRVCEICGKKPIIGNNVSHAHKKTKRHWRPNLQTTRIVEHGTPKKIRVCASCLKAGKAKSI